MRKIAVFFDSNALYSFRRGSLPIENNTFKLIYNLKEKGIVDLFVSEIVIDELYKKWVKEYYEIFNKLEKNIKDFKNFLSECSEFKQENPFFPSYKFTKSYFPQCNVIKNNFHISKLTILPIPDLHLDEVYKRDLKARKPFKIDGRGFRDFLIWKTLCETLENTDEFHEEVFFITDNIEDFGNAEGVLHGDLVTDLPEGYRVILVRKMKDFLNYDLIKDRSERDFKIKLCILNVLNELLGKPLSTFENTYLGNFSSDPISVAGIEGEFVDLEIICDSIKYHDNETSRMLRDSFAIKASVEVECVIESFMEKSDYYMYDEDDIDVDVCDDDWNDYMMRVQQTRHLRFELSGNFLEDSSGQERDCELSIDGVQDITEQ